MFRGVTQRPFSVGLKSNYGKNRKSSTLGAGECVTDVPTALWRPLWSINEQAHHSADYICFMW